MATEVQKLVTKALINGAWHTLLYNSTSQKFEKSITAPHITSYNLPGGYYPITIEVADEAGNKTVIDDNHATLGSACKLIVKETTPPVISVIYPGDGSTVGINNPIITLQLREEVNGSGVDMSTFTFQIDSNVALGQNATGMTITQVENGYDISYQPQAGFIDGVHRLTVNISDFDGNSAFECVSTFTIDTAPPVLSVLTPTNGAATNQPTINVTGSTNDLHSSPVSVVITVNDVDQGTVVVDADGSFNHPINLTEGANVILVRTTDGIGKYSQITRNVTLDTKAPTISAIELSSSVVNTEESVIVKVTVIDS